MKNLFSYDSELMRVLNFIADLFICNLLFLLCCLPVVTSGASWAGLCTAMRILTDPEDDSSCAKGFFRGFKNGIVPISGAWLFFLLLDGILLYSFLMALSYRETGLLIHWGFPLAVMILVLIIHSLLPVFHARFACGFWQLIKNCWVLLLANPLRAIPVGLLTWAPIALFLLAPTVWVRCSPLFFTVYFSLTALLSVTLMQKPFKLLTDHFYGNDEEPPQ